MFNKRLQAFDSDSLKSLFLNVFEVKIILLRQVRTFRLNFSMTQIAILLLVRVMECSDLAVSRVQLNLSRNHKQGLFVQQVNFLDLFKKTS